MAEQKITMEMTLKKQIRKWTDKLQAEKTQREQENKSWFAKYDAMVASYEKKLQELK